MPHTPTAAQNTRLASLQSAVVTAQSALASAQSTLKTANETYLNAVRDAKHYEAYIYGNSSRSGVIDEGSKDIA